MAIGVTANPIVFGTELRRRRVEAGLSLAGLSGLAHYSKSHLSKVETGSKPPSTDLAKICDAALSAHGELARLVPPTIVGASDRMPNDDQGEVWVLTLDARGNTEARLVSRRQVMIGGAAGLVGLTGLAYQPTRRPGDIGDAELGSFRTMFDQFRVLGQYVSPSTLIPMLIPQTYSLQSLAQRSSAGNRINALVLAARFAEYTGWMTQESGDDGHAAWWTDRAVDLASAAGDSEMAAYAQVRRALITLYRNDASQTVELAQAAQVATRNPRIRGLAAQREAQGWALAGRYDDCHRAMDRAAALLACPSESGGPVIGSANVADPASAAIGWCYYDLGLPDRAATALRRELDRIATTALRARARYGARLCLALAASGEPEEACVVAESVLDAYERIDSATIRADLSSLSRVLNRWHAHPKVRDTGLRLTTALSTAPRPRMA